MRTRNFPDHDEDGIGHQARRVGAIASIGKTEAREIQRVYGPGLAVVLEEWPDLVGRCCRVHAMDKKHRFGDRGRTGVIVAKRSGLAREIASIPGEGGRQGDTMRDKERAVSDPDRRCRDRKDDEDSEHSEQQVHFHTFLGAQVATMAAGHFRPGMGKLHLQSA